MAFESQFAGFMERVFSGRRPGKTEVRALVEAMIGGSMSESRIAASLTALRGFPLNSDCLHGALEAILKHAPRNSYADSGKNRHLVDCGGTGGGTVPTVNLSTMAAVVAATCGAKVAKFGARGVASRCGSADVLETLGVTLAANVPTAEREIESIGLTFLYSPSVYPRLRTVSAVRRSLGFHTLFDILMPLATPFPLSGQLLGVYTEELQVLLARALTEMGRERALVVHSAEGLDEISVSGPTRIIKVQGGRQSAEMWHPRDFGLEPCSGDVLRGGGADENARAFHDCLDGAAPQAMRDSVCVNAAATLWCAGVTDDLRDAFRMAREALTSGRARTKLESWISFQKSHPELQGAPRSQPPGAAS